MIGRRPEYPWIPCRNYTPASSRRVDLIVVHTMEAPESASTAENVAAWAAGPNAPRASWHYACDNNSTVQCVREHDVAWGAPGANHDGVHIEHAGFARQGRADWNDPYSQAMLRYQSAPLAAKLAISYDVPVRHLSVAEARAGAKGFIGHIDATNAWPGPGRSHWDPGPSFPWGMYLSWVRQEKIKLTAPPLSAEKEYWLWVEWWLGEGRYSGKGRRSKPRPSIVRTRIPPAWWLRLGRFLARRMRR